MNAKLKSEVQVNMQVPTSSTWSNTDGRTDKRTKNLVANVEHLAKVDAREGGDFATVREVFDAGLWPTGERHPVIRRGERAEIPKYVRAAVWFRDQGRCCLCPRGTALGEWHLDHIKPWSAGGSDRTENLRVLCAMHNLERSNQIIPDERPRLPATWWCSRCYMLDEHSWRHPADDAPFCPTHPRPEYFYRFEERVPINPRCSVQRGYLREFETTGEWPVWHQRTMLVDSPTIAYCAHCNLRGVTGRTL